MEYRPYSWELKTQGQNGKVKMMPKGKHLPQKALQERKPSQAGELQLEALGVLAWELQESPGVCLTLVQAYSCTSPRAGPAPESLGRFPQQKEECLPKEAAAPTCTGARLLLAPADPGTSSCSKAGWIGKAAPRCQDAYLAAAPSQDSFSLCSFSSHPPTPKQEFR